MRVFVSSTYRDLSQYREVIRLALETSGYQFRGMEHFAADTLPSLEVCLRELDESDVYVGMIGGTYGSCPPRRSLSYTELESKRATNSGKYQIWLLMRNSAPVTPDQMEQDPGKIVRLKSFRKRMSDAHTCQFFGDPHEAAWQILASLHTYEVRLAEEDVDG